ncbi:ankyrin repeat-containing domain protein [Aspergillus keveii]|uniref:Ankyrin repeat-containing domain protein n=1 Tax=Aspergillus keveii TaxID=714993 RepID=A0ABR4FIM1_9EURO
MHPTPLPLDIEYLILEELSYLVDDPTLDEYRTIQNCLCVCSRWHSTLQELLIRNNPAGALLRHLNKVGQLGVKRLAAEYVARTRNHHPDDDATTNTNTNSPSQRVILQHPKPYSSGISNDPRGEEYLAVLAKDLERCTRIAPRLGDLDSLRTCLEVGAAYNSWWMLVDAVSHDRRDIVQYILDAGYGFTDPERRRTCMTRLMQRAINNGRREIVAIFLDRGFDARDSLVDARILVDGRYRSATLVSYAASQRQVGVLDVLLQRGLSLEDSGVPVRPVYFAVKHDDMAMMEVFIKHGVDLSPGESGKDWPLKWAVQGGSVEMVRLLLEHAPLPRWGRFVKKILLQAVEERGDDGIRQVLASYGFL